MSADDDRVLIQMFLPAGLTVKKITVGDSEWEVCPPFTVPADGRFRFVLDGDTLRVEGPL